MKCQENDATKRKAASAEPFGMWIHNMCNVYMWIGLQYFWSIGWNGMKPFEIGAFYHVVTCLERREPDLNFCVSCGDQIVLSAFHGLDCCITSHSRFWRIIYIYIYTYIFKRYSILMDFPKVSAAPRVFFVHSLNWVKQGEIVFKGRYFWTWRSESPHRGWNTLLAVDPKSYRALPSPNHGWPDSQWYFGIPKFRSILEAVDTTTLHRPFESTHLAALHFIQPFRVACERACQCKTSWALLILAVVANEQQVHGKSKHP